MPQIIKKLRIESNESNKKTLKKILLQLILISMLKFNSRQEITRSAKSAFSINFPFYVFALGILLAFSAFQCEGEEWCNADNQSCDKDECEVLHTATIKVEQVVCGFGVWENNWFNDGSKVYLQPYSISNEAKAQLEKLNIEIKAGLHLKIQYQHAKDDGTYKDAIICLAYPGESQFIKINAVEVVNN